MGSIAQVQPARHSYTGVARQGGCFTRALIFAALGAGVSSLALITLDPRLKFVGYGGGVIALGLAMTAVLVAAVKALISRVIALLHLIASVLFLPVMVLSDSAGLALLLVVLVAAWLMTRPTRSRLPAARSPGASGARPLFLLGDRGKRTSESSSTNHL